MLTRMGCSSPRMVKANWGGFCTRREHQTQSASPPQRFTAESIKLLFHAGFSCSFFTSNIHSDDLTSLPPLLC